MSIGSEKADFIVRRTEHCNKLPQRRYRYSVLGIIQNNTGYGPEQPNIHDSALGRRGQTVAFDVIP